jgi:hypothetical protein
MGDSKINTKYPLKIKADGLLIEPNIFYNTNLDLGPFRYMYIGKYISHKYKRPTSRIDNLLIEELSRSERAIRDFIIQYSPSTEDTHPFWKQFKENIYFEKALLPLIMDYLKVKPKKPKPQKIAEK